MRNQPGRPLLGPVPQYSRAGSERQQGIRSERGNLMGTDTPNGIAVMPRTWKITMEEGPLPPDYLNARLEPIVILMRSPGNEIAPGDWRQDWCTLAVEARRLGYCLQSIGGVWGDSEFVADPREFDLVVRGDENDNGRLKGLMRKFLGEGTSTALIWKDEGQLDALLMFPDGSHEELGPLTMPMLGQVHARVRGRLGDTFTFDRKWCRRGWFGYQLASRGLI